MPRQIVIIIILTISTILYIEATFADQDYRNVTFATGIRFFKYSAESGPNEIAYNPVFEKWEKINKERGSFNVHKYEPLQPLYFNMNFGIDMFIRIKKRLLLKIGYDYSNPFGIGGKGKISYSISSTGTEIQEKKQFSYTSHQVNYFFGPLLSIGENRGEAYLGISMMSPTWVKYRESYSLIENGHISQEYDKKFKGFFGGCRLLLGIQVPVFNEKFIFGGETVFTFLNYTELDSDELTYYSFRFPIMKWNFTLRYELF